MTLKLLLSTVLCIVGAFLAVNFRYSVDEVGDILKILSHNNTIPTSKEVDKLLKSNNIELPDINVIEPCLGEYDELIGRMN